MSRLELNRFADRYIESVLDIDERLKDGRDLRPQQVQASLLSQLREGQQSAHHSDDWDAAIYALAAWTDELMLETSWTGQTWWNDHVIEATLFGTRMCSERFFQVANAAAQDPASGVLRIFHDCVLLGFQGIYSLPGFEQGLDDATAKSLSVPSTIDGWLLIMQNRLTAVGEFDGHEKLHRSLDGAPCYLERHRIIWWSVGAAFLLAINLTVYGLRLHSS